MMSALGQLGGRLYRGEVSFDFVGRKRLWYAISGLILVISIVAVVVRGLSFSVDFKGGAVFTFPSSSTTLSSLCPICRCTRRRRASRARRRFASHRPLTPGQPVDRNGDGKVRS